MVDAILTAADGGCPLLESLVMHACSASVMTGQTTACLRLKLKNHKQSPSEPNYQPTPKIHHQTDNAAEAVSLRRQGNTITADRPLPQTIIKTTD
jgi:hypothetical protein